MADKGGGGRALAQRAYAASRSAHTLAGTMASFGTYAVGFVARPLGGIVFGHYGDKIGRKSMLVMTLMMMGLSTFLIGLLPTCERLPASAE